MSYSEENGQVILTMSRKDYDIVLMALGAFTAMTWDKEKKGVRLLSLLNRLNEGNLSYTPYEISEVGEREKIGREEG